MVRAPRMEWFGVSGSAARLEYAGKAPGRMAADGGWTGPWMPVKRAGAEGTTMQELRFVAVSEDGRYAVLAVPGRSARFTLPIDERLRAVALGQTSRLAQYEIEVESPLRPKEIQARIRAGETVEDIADAAGIAIERVRWFEGPVLAERAYIAQQAQTASIRRQGDAAPSTPGPRLGEVVAERLTGFGVDPEDAQWDAKKRGDGSWQVQLTFITGGRLHVAEWVFDPRRQACTARRRQRRPHVAAGCRAAAAGASASWRGHGHPAGPEARRGLRARCRSWRTCGFWLRRVRVWRVCVRAGGAW